jgi:hypothetical protein
VKLSRIPVRVATGAFILNSGLSQQGWSGRQPRPRTPLTTDA